jgi:predicted nucleotidyltransferase
VIAAAILVNGGGGVGLVGHTAKVSRSVGYLYPMGTLADILSVLRRERARLFAKYGLKSMAVFGSATRDDFRPDSDVDIMVEFEPGADFDYFDLLIDLQGIVQREVDLVMRTAVKPHYMEFIEKDLKYV